MFQELPSALSRRMFLQSAGTAAASAASVAAEAMEPAPTARSPAIVPEASTRQVSVGVVGGGFGRSFQWHLHPKAKVAAVCDLRDDRLAGLKKTYRCPNAYKDFRELLRHPGLDAVAIFTPPQLHSSTSPWRRQDRLDQAGIAERQGAVGSRLDA
jgi:hypothetical protein